MIYRASSRPIEERVNFKNLDQYLKSGLIDNGIELNYHFKAVSYTHLTAITRLSIPTTAVPRSR